MVAVVVVGGCTSRAAPQGFSGLVSSGQTLYASSAGGKVVALNAALRADDAAFPGAGEWEYAATRATKGMFGCGSSQAASIIYGAPVYDDNHLCVGTYDGKVLMLDGDSRSASQAFPQARSGEWQYPRGEDTIGPIVGAPVIDGDMVFVCSSTRDGGQTSGLVYALDRSFGDELWVSPALDGKLWVTPAVEDGVVYVTTFDGHIYALSAQTGERMPWSYEANVGFVSSPLIQDGMVFAGSFDRMLYAIEVGADSPAWSYHAGNWFWATPVMSGGVLYAPNMDGNLYAFNAGTGDLAWTRPFDAGSAIAAGPLLAGDKVVVATKDGNVFLVDAATGAGVRVPNPDNEKATTVNATVIAAPVLHQGLVYVLPQNSTVTAVDPVAATVKYQFSLETE
jgi:outer membrane protein assembly factor BamB